MIIRFDRFLGNYHSFVAANVPDWRYDPWGTSVIINTGGDRMSTPVKRRSLSRGLRFLGYR